MSMLGDDPYHRPDAGLASRFDAARPCLDGPEHGARITLDGTPSRWSCRTRRRALVENRPRGAGELVGQRDGEHIVVEPLLRRLNPRFEPIALPLLRPELD